MSHAPNTRLHDVLGLAGWSKGELARLVNRQAAAMGHDHLATDASRVRRWIDSGESPREPVPSVLAALFTERLGRVVTVEDLGFVRRRRPAGRHSGGVDAYTHGLPWAPERTASVLTEFTGADLLLLRADMGLPEPEPEPAPEPEPEPEPEPGQGVVHVEPAPPARRTTALAARLSGPRRSHLRDEWAAVLAGDPERGTTLSQRRQFAYALGFLFAAVRMRAHDLLGGLWAPVDWVLSDDARSNGFLAASLGGLALYIQWHDGLHTLLTEGWGWCGACGGTLFALTRWLRRVRGIELAGPDGPEA